MTIKREDISYLPEDLRKQIIEALTPAEITIINDYCDMTNVKGVRVKAYYPGGFAAIKILADNGSSTQIKLEATSPLAKILHNRAFS